MSRGTRAGRPIDPARAARRAGLRYVSDDRPGISRERGPLGFRYRRADGRLVRQPAELARIARLAVPPAWTDVWICPDPRGHLQATGRDARGRKQYRYHPDWRVHRDETKYDRLPAFAAALPAMRARTRADLARPGLPREKVLAAVVQLLERSLIRVGNDEYARANRSYGLTTLRDRHVRVRGGRVRFEFRGKSGVRHAIEVDDRRLAGIIRDCRDLPGQELFQYVDDAGCRRRVCSDDVNRYLRQMTGQDFTAKDFRTWAGTVLACRALREAGKLLPAIDAVAGVLGNTRSVCRTSYIHPRVIEAFNDGVLDEALTAGAAAKRVRGLRADEVAVLALLRGGARPRTRAA